MIFPKIQLHTYICNTFSYYNYINQKWESNNLIYKSIIATYIIKLLIIAKQNVAVSHIGWFFK